MKKTIFIAAILAVATVLAAGLTALPSSIQEAQANPCASSTESDSEGEGVVVVVVVPNTDERECTFIGPVELDED